MREVMTMIEDRRENGEDEAGVDRERLAEKIRGRERTRREAARAQEPVEVPERMAGLFVYVEPLVGPEAGRGETKWYSEGERWLVAQRVEDVIMSAEPVCIISGRQADVGAVTKRREALARAAQEIAEAARVDALGIPTQGAEL